MYEIYVSNIKQKCNYQLLNILSDLTEIKIFISICQRVFIKTMISILSNCFRNILILRSQTENNRRLG